jgi:hypothetical protein
MSEVDKAEPANGWSVPINSRAKNLADVLGKTITSAVPAPGPTFRHDSAPFFLVLSHDPLNGAWKAKMDLKFWK